MKSLSLKYWFLSFLIAGGCFVSSCDQKNTATADGENHEETVNQTENLKCVDGSSAGKYPCKNIDLLAHLSRDDFQGDSLRLNDIWGWTDPQTGKEYALVGLNDGVSFVDISTPTEPRVIGKLEESIGSAQGAAVDYKRGFHDDHEGKKSAWRDFKVYNNYLFVISDGQPHGLQVFDLTRLRNVSSPPKTFTEDALYEEFGNAHNVAINRETGFAYVAGSNTYGGGLHIIDIKNSLQPELVGFHSDSTVGLDSTGYVHDTQCVIYQGEDTDYRGDEICFNSSETHFVVADVSNKDSTYTIAKSDYEGVEYTHQGWLTEDHNYFLLNDELDELNSGSNTRTIIWDVRNLDNPEVIGIYKSPNYSIDHNLYVKGKRVYQSNYTTGLRVLSLENVAGGELNEVAYFDTFPRSNAAEFDGAWSNYPFFESGVVVVSDVSNGLFILKPTLD